jgi:hypothetical protein
MKSRPSTDSDATTTVRVVALATPRAWPAPQSPAKGNEGHGDAKHQALDHAVAHVPPDIDAALDLAPEGSGIHADHQHAHHPAANDAHGAEHGRQQGMVMTPAQNRGARMRCTGSTAIISITLICSPAFIRPISAVSDVPARPANSKAVTTGPKFPHQVSVTSRPSASDEP